LCIDLKTEKKITSSFRLEGKVVLKLKLTALNQNESGLTKSQWVKNYLSEDCNSYLSVPVQLNNKLLI
jgi:hypothetical protein